MNTGMAAFYAPCDKLFPDDGVLGVGELNKPSWVFCELDLSKVHEIKKVEVLNFKDRDLLGKKTGN